MGCVSSKLFKKELQQDIIVDNGRDCVNHVVSLTSSTYGALKLEEQQQPTQPQPEPEAEAEPKPTVKEITVDTKQKSPSREELEVVNTWELMKDLEEEPPASTNIKKSPKSRLFLRDIDAKTPLKFINSIGSPRKAKTFGGKENKVRKASEFSPRPVFKANNSSEKQCKAAMRLNYPIKGCSPMSNKAENLCSDSEISSRRRRSFSPMFDPELVAMYERELSKEDEQVKRIISPATRPQRSKDQKCLSEGENAVLIYTTTLRGIRKTFEDCNVVRSIIESHNVNLIEKDISMDSGYKEELRCLMGTKEVKVPVVFVREKLIGGVDQVMKLEEEGKLGILFDGLPRGLARSCGGCGGIRFVMCVECNGSCKVLDEKQEKMVKCGVCNENGLMHCPVCC